MILEGENKNYFYIMINNLISIIRNNNKFLVIYFLKFFSLALRLGISLLFVNFLSDSDFTIYLKVITTSGFVLSFLTIYFQNIILNNIVKEVNSFTIMGITSLSFFSLFFITFFLSNDFKISLFVLIYFFVPISYFLSQTLVLEGKSIKAIFFENLLQNLIFLIIFLIIFLYKDLAFNSVVSLDVLIFSVFISWAITCFFGIKLIKRRFNFNVSRFDKESINKNLYFIVNSMMIYALTKIDLIIFFINEEEVFLKEYYATQKFGEIIGVASEIVWIFFAFRVKKIIELKNKIELATTLRKLNLINFISIITIGIAIFILIFILNYFTNFNYTQNYSLLLIFLIVYGISNFLNIYYQLLLLNNLNTYIFKSLFITLIVILLQYFIINLPMTGKMIVMVSTYLILSRLIMFYFFKQYSGNLKINI